MRFNPIAASALCSWLTIALSSTGVANIRPSSRSDSRSTTTAPLPPNALPRVIQFPKAACRSKSRRLRRGSVREWTQTLAVKKGQHSFGVIVGADGKTPVDTPNKVERPTKATFQCELTTTKRSSATDKRAPSQLKAKQAHVKWTYDEPVSVPDGGRLVKSLGATAIASAMRQLGFLADSYSWVHGIELRLDKDAKALSYTATLSRSRTPAETTECNFAVPLKRLNPGLLDQARQMIPDLDSLSPFGKRLVDEGFSANLPDAFRSKIHALYPGKSARKLTSSQERSSSRAESPLAKPKRDPAEPTELGPTAGSFNIRPKAPRNRTSTHSSTRSSTRSTMDSSISSKQSNSSDSLCSSLSSRSVRSAAAKRRVRYGALWANDEKGGACAPLWAQSKKRNAYALGAAFAPRGKAYALYSHDADGRHFLFRTLPGLLPLHGLRQLPPALSRWFHGLRQRWFPRPAEADNSLPPLATSAMDGVMAWQPTWAQPSTWAQPQDKRPKAPINSDLKGPWDDAGYQQMWKEAALSLYTSRKATEPQPHQPSL